MILHSNDRENSKGTFCRVIVTLIFTIIYIGYPSSALSQRSGHVFDIDGQNFDSTDTLNDFKGDGFTEIMLVQDAPLLTNQVSTRKLNIPLPGHPQSKEDVKKSLRQYLIEHPQLLLGLDIEDLRLNYSIKIPAKANRPAMVFILFKQYFENQIVEESHLRYSIKILENDSLIVSAVARVFPNVHIPKKQEHENQFLINQAKQNLNIKESNVTTGRKSIRFVEGAWHKVLEVVFDKIPNYKFLIDVYSGTILTKEDQFVHAIGPPKALPHRFIKNISGHVSGRGVIFDPGTTGDNLDTLNLTDLLITDSQGNTTHTNTEGGFSFTGLFNPTVITAKLSGKWIETISCVGSTIATCDVTNSDLVEMDLASAHQPASILFNPNGNDEYDTAQVNGYYHGTFMHNWFKERFPPTFTGIDIPLRTYVNVPDPVGCGGFYAPVNFIPTGGFQPISIILFDSGLNWDFGGIFFDSCINTAFDTFVLHEYTHFVDDMTGGLQDLNVLAEGWADLFATYATDQPIWAENFTDPPLVEPDGIIRTVDNNCTYVPQGLTPEGCRLASTFSGFGWQLRENLKASLGETQGIEMAESLTIAGILSGSIDIPNAVFDIVLIDDDDGDLSNGTPHLAEIEAAANHHNIPLLHQCADTVPCIFSTIQEAIDNAVNGDVILVDPASYNAIETIDFKGKAITVKSTDSINQFELERALFQNGEGRDTILDGFLIQFQTLALVDGGAIFIDNSSPTIKNGKIFDNSLNGSNGGGIYCQNNAAPLIINNIIARNNIIPIGILGGNGGGVACYNSAPELINNTISGNTASDGGGIYLNNSNAVITNSILWNNTASTNPEISLDNSTATITYSNVQGGFSGEGNIDGDPLFIDPSNNDFHLSSGGIYFPGSPSIDAANGDVALNLDLEGHPRVDDPSIVNTGIGNPNFVDMGALETQLP